MTIDFSSPDGFLQGGLHALLAGHERMTMLRKIESSKNATRRQGGLPTNNLTLPLGVSYDRQTRKFYYNEKIQTVIKIFRLYDADGVVNYHEIGRRTGQFNVTVRNILRNPIYTGWRVICQKRGEKTVSRNGKTYRKKTNRAPEDVIRVRVIETPAISQECFDRVQASMDQVRFNHHERRKNEEVHNFAAGIGRCGSCGEILLCSSGKSSARQRHGYYQCKANYYSYVKRLGGCKQPNVRQQEIDDLVEGFTIKTLTDPKNLTALVVGSLHRSNAVISTFPVKPPSDQLASIKKREKRLLDAYEGGALTVEELRERREALRREVASLKALVTSKPKQRSLELEQFIKLVVRGALRLKRLNDRQEKKLIIQSLFSEIIVKDQTIIGLKFRSDVPLGDISEVAAKASIMLDRPFRLRPEPEPMPTGHKRCSCCENVRPIAEFYPRRNECRVCLKVKNSEAHARRRAERMLS